MFSLLYSPPRKICQTLIKKLIQKYLLFYQKIQKDTLHQDLEVVKLMKFSLDLIAYG